MSKNFTLIIVFLFLGMQVFSQSAPSWNFIGPIQFPINKSGQINGIGRVVQLKFHPTKANIMYAVAAHSLWKTTDTANTWQVVPGIDALPSLNTASICLDYTDDNTLYVGGGDANYYSSSLFGVIKSTDGGNTFVFDTAGIGKRLVIQILMSPFDHNTLVAATNDGIWKSADGGSTWVENVIGGQFSDMQFKANPSGTNTIYAVTKAGGFYLSTDMGDSWTQITSVAPSTAGGGGRIAVTVADSTIVYTGFIGSNNTVGGIVFRSSDGGNTFTLMKDNVAPNLVGYTSSTAGQGNYNFDMAASQSNPNSVYVVAHIIWKSDDGGTTWAQTIGNWASYIHTDMHCMRFHPLDTSKLFNCNDGGVWLSTDRGYTWNPRSNGLGATEFYHFAGSKSVKYLIQGGAQDNGGIYYYTDTWYTNQGGDVTTPFFFDNANSNTAYSVANGTRKNIVTNGTSVSYKLPFTAASADVYALSYFNNGVAYVGHVDSVYMTTNMNTASAGSMVWNKIVSFSAQVMAVATSPADPNILYVATKGSLGAGKIYRSDNAQASTPTFTQVSVTPNSTNYNAFFAPSKNNSNIVYMSNGSHVYKSYNKGISWTELTSNLNTSINITGLVADTSNAAEGIYLISGTLYYKDSTMSNWMNYGAGLPTCSGLRDINIFYDTTAKNSTVRVGFYGRGVWESPTYVIPATTLPVNIQSFTAQATINKGVQLKWTTLQETNNAYFEVERSSDANNFSKLTTVAGHNNSTVSQDYSTIDPSPYSGTTYYRLKQVDASGNFSYSATIPFEASVASTFKVYPNPAKNNATIQFESNSNKNVFITVSDISGKIVMWRNQNAVTGINKVSVDLASLSSGIYMINVNDGVRKTTLKLIVQK